MRLDKFLGKSSGDLKARVKDNISGERIFYVMDWYDYSNLKELYINTLISLDEVFYKAYIYNYKGNMIYDDTVCIFYLYNIINLKYQANDRIITDIIEAGEINE